jgi:hypothetical protein
LLLYFRSNYHWYLKNIVPLLPNDLFCPLASQSHSNQLLIVRASSFEILEFTTRLP